MNTFVHNHNDTMHYVNKSLNEWRDYYAKCTEGNLSSLKTITIKYPLKPNESYTVLFDPEYIFKRENLTTNGTESLLNCDLMLFDKKMNTGDYLKHLVYKNVSSFKLKLNESRVLEILVDISGFYFMECWLEKANASSKSVYREVFSILPHNMKQLLDANRQSRIETDKLRRDYEKKDAHHKKMLTYADYEECEKIQGGELPKKMNVLIIVLDSVALPFLKRSFPLTYNYLIRDLENNLIFESLNIVGENTYPNMLSILTGAFKEANAEFGIKDETKFFQNELNESTYHDLFPFMWYDYERLGYLTAYREDKPIWGTFRYMKEGFR
jgi:hypothetical protein